MNITFVGGIHGVGKTTCCTRIAKTLGLRHHSASELIRQQRATAISENSKIVLDAAANQRLLIAAVNSLRPENTDLILDGHFTLMDKTGAIKAIDTSVFCDLTLSAIVVFYDKEESISERLKARDNHEISPEFLLDWQSQELECARKVANTLGIRCTELPAFDIAGLETMCMK